MKENNWFLIPWFVTKYNKDLLSLQQILSGEKMRFSSFLVSRTATYFHSTGRKWTHY